MRWVLHVALMGEKRYAYSMLVGKADEERSLARNMQRWEYDIKMRHKAIKCYVVDSIVWAQEREMWRVCVKAVTDVQIPCNSGNLLSS
jgi:hypothetical protein